MDPITLIVMLTLWVFWGAGLLVGNHRAAIANKRRDAIAREPRVLTAADAYREWDKVLASFGHDAVVKELPASIAEDFTAAGRPCPKHEDARHSWREHSRNAINVQSFGTDQARIYTNHKWSCLCGAITTRQPAPELLAPEPKPDPIARDTTLTREQEVAAWETAKLWRQMYGRDAYERFMDAQRATGKSWTTTQQRLRELLSSSPSRAEIQLGASAAVTPYRGPATPKTRVIETRPTRIPDHREMAVFRDVYGTVATERFLQRRQAMAGDWSIPQEIALLSMGADQVLQDAHRQRQLRAAIQAADKGYVVDNRTWQSGGVI